jgi:hypothetical protein
LSFRRGRFARGLTSTFPMAASPLPHSPLTSATNAPLDSFTPSSSASTASGNDIFHTLTVPSLLPVAMRWYDLPQFGAHAMDVTVSDPGGPAGWEPADVEPEPAANEL